MGLHRKQLAILSRGLHLLAEGGRLAYSTCSLNPVENEAVVAAALSAFRGSVELVPGAAATLQQAGFKSHSGLKTWLVPGVQSVNGKKKEAAEERRQVDLFDSF